MRPNKLARHFSRIAAASRAHSLSYIRARVAVLEAWGACCCTNIRAYNGGKEVGSAGHALCRRWTTTTGTGLEAHWALPSRPICSYRSLLYWQLLPWALNGKAPALDNAASRASGLPGSLNCGVVPAGRRQCSRWQYQLTGRSTLTWIITEPVLCVEDVVMRATTAVRPSARATAHGHREWPPLVALGRSVVMDASTAGSAAFLTAVSCPRRTNSTGALCCVQACTQICGTEDAMLNALLAGKKKYAACPAGACLAATWQPLPSTLLI